MKDDGKEVLLNLLIKLDEVCRRHHLRYYLAYGTCIGAIVSEPCGIRASFPGIMISM